jgi:hypothetical protein
MAATALFVRFKRVGSDLVTTFQGRCNESGNSLELFPHVSGVRATIRRSEISTTYHSAPRFSLPAPWQE